jgi:hypothetical protein
MSVLISNCSVILPLKSINCKQDVWMFLYTKIVSAVIGFHMAEHSIYFSCVWFYFAWMLLYTKIVSAVISSHKAELSFYFSCVWFYFV